MTVEGRAVARRDSLVEKSQRGGAEFIGWNDVKPLTDAFLNDAMPDVDAQRFGADSRQSHDA